MKINQFFAHEESSTGSAALVLMASLFLANLLGLLKLRLFAQLFRGASSELGLFIVADRIPNFIFSVLAVGALSASFVPIVSRHLASDKREKAFQLTTTLFNISLSLFLVAAVFFFPLSQKFSQVLSWGNPLSDSELKLLDQTMKILFFAQIFFILSAFSSGLLQSFNRFRAIALPPIIYNLVIIFFTYFLAPRLGIMAAAWGTVLGAFFHFAVQVPALWAVGFRYFPKINWRDKDLREIGRLFLPRSLSLTVDQLGLLFFTSLALSLSGAVVVIFNFAQRLVFLPITLFGSTFAQASFATLSRNAELNRPEFFRVFDKVFNYLAFLLIPTSAFFVVLRIPLIRLFFGARGFDLVATTLTANTLSFLALGIFFEAQTSLLARAFFAYKDTRTPLKSAFISLLFGVFLALVFLRVFDWGVWSLGLAVSAISFLNFVIMFSLLSKKFPEMRRADFLRPSFKMLLAGISSALVIFLTVKLLDSRWPVFDTRYVLSLLFLTVLAGLLGGLTYLGLCYLLGIREGKKVVRLVLNVRNFGPNFLSELIQE